MTKSYQELQIESQQVVKFLLSKNISAWVDEQSFRDYNVRIRGVLGASILLYHKPSAGTFSIGTHEIKDEVIKEQITILWHQYQYPDEQIIKGLCAYVDGSFYNHKIGWGVVLVEDNIVLEEKHGLVPLSAEEGARQIAGEVQAVLEALAYAEENKITEITIYYDYIGLQKWACGMWKAQSQIAQYYVAKLMQYRIRISWHKVKAHTGNRFNEIADKLAKKSLIS